MIKYQLFTNKIDIIITKIKNKIKYEENSRTS